MNLKNATKDDLLNGITMLIDKPLGWTSFDVVNKLKFLLKNRAGLKKIKIGHAGTLDPLASGLLIICCGKNTKLIESFQEFEKEYSGIFLLGATTPSFDLETEVDFIFSIDHVSLKSVKEEAEKFIGDISQMPPIFSAKKIDGKRAYDIARKGKVPDVKPKMVNISKFEIVKFDLPDIHFNIVCSKGTYIRSIAKDLGIALKSGAYLKALRRERIGNFKVENAMSIDDAQNAILFNPNLVKNPTEE
ncbi:MAG: tRNA pseudouridine(55) synthase TruB [Bacteroidetes bacterium]|nr:tRNA pseudouridine(55) synthase TruB [Bacteroidota bacterium]